MARNFQFRDSTGAPVPLTQIDEEICNKVGIPVDPDHYSFHYMALTEMGLVFLLKYGGMDVTLNHIKLWELNVIDHPAEEDKDDSMITEWASVWRPLAEYFLCGNYVYHAWG